MEMKTHTPSPAQTVSHELTAEHHAARPLLVGTMTGLAFRVDGWPSFNGSVNFGYNDGRIHAGSHVFVSASEIDNAGNRWNGLAPFTVENIVPKEGRVEFRLNIGWNSPLRVSTDILVINP
jgi:hypothetical protein